MEEFPLAMLESFTSGLFTCHWDEVKRLASLDHRPPCTPGRPDLTNHPSAGPAETNSKQTSHATTFTLSWSETPSPESLSTGLSPQSEQPAVGTPHAPQPPATMLLLICPLLRCEALVSNLTCTQGPSPNSPLPRYLRKSKLCSKCWEALKDLFFDNSLGPSGTGAPQSRWKGSSPRFSGIRKKTKQKCVLMPWGLSAYTVAVV